MTAVRVDRTRFEKEQWGTCDGTIGYQDGTGILIARCGRPALFVAREADNDGNTRRYCRDCASAA